MPIYEYKCRKCGKVFEVLQKFSDDPVKTHPDCGGDVEKLISTSALQFKGSGWYVSDYAKGSSATIGNSTDTGEAKLTAEAKADNKASESKSSGESKPAESAPAAKPAATESKPTAAPTP